MSSSKDQGWGKMEIVLNLTTMMERAIGSEHGISEEEIAEKRNTKKIILSRRLLKNV